MNALVTGGTGSADRDEVIARVIVDVLGRVRDRELSGAYDDLRELPSGVHDAVLTEARTRTALERAERDALQSFDRGAA